MKTILPSVLLLLALCIQSAAQETQTQTMPTVSKLRIKETRLTGLRQSFMDESLVVSPDFTRVAYVNDTGSKKELILNDKRIAAYGDIQPSSLRFSPDSKRLAFVACKSGALLTMADINARTGRSHLMIAPAGGELVVAVDGKEYGPFQAVDPKGLVFTPDSAKLVFPAKKSIVGWDLYVDGEPLKNDFDDVACTMATPTVFFSPNSAHMAYAAMRGDKWRVVLDGKPGPEYDSIVPDSIVFSPDGTRFAYAAVKDNRTMVVLDGKEQQPFSEISQASLVFSANGKRFGYLAARRDGRETRCFAVIDGAPGKEFALTDAGAPTPSQLSADKLAFSPDGSRYAWVLWNHHDTEPKETASVGAQLVLDGVLGPEFRSVLSDLHFSPDGKHLAYVAAFGKAASPRPYGDVRLVVDGIEGPRDYAMDYPSVAFSPDSRYAVCIGMKPNTVAPGEYRAHLRVNGTASKDYLNFLAAAPYGQRTTPLSAKTEIVFTGPRTFMCAAYIHWSIARLDVTIEE